MSGLEGSLIGARQTRRGGPLLMLLVVLGLWGGARVALWQSPFPIQDIGFPSSELLFAEAGQAEGEELTADLADQTRQNSSIVSFDVPMGNIVAASWYGVERNSFAPPYSRSPYHSPYVASGQQLLIAKAFGTNLSKSSQTNSLRQPIPLNSSGARASSQVEDLDRWSLDASLFFRSGSNSTAISQGRVPVYGASQIATRLQYRFAPRSSLDPRIFLRGYRAFVPEGENDVALGLSARPIRQVPVRLATEVRVTENEFGTDIRTAAYVVSELSPQSLPLGAQLEAYGGAGYVGGEANTFFADGQIAVTREIARINALGNRPQSFSAGAGAWGGAQRDAHRVDVGPSVRFDLQLGEVPARLSVDWRERIVGDAAPQSGVAATLSTRF